MGPKSFYIELLKWSCLRLSINIFSRSRCIRVSETSHHRSLRGVAFAEFDWKYHIFLNIETEERDLKTLLFSYRNGLVLGEVETYFLEVIAYVSLKRVTTGVREGRFCWIWLKISDFFKYKNGGEGSKSFIVWLLKWSCLGLCINIFSGNRCMRVSGTSHCRFLRRSVLLNLTESITSF